MNYYKAAPEAMQAMRALSQYVHECGLEPSLAELVKTRASQINGCAFCLELHTREARAAGETEARLYLLSAWRESSLYTERERAALAWAEAITLVTDGHVADDVYAKVKAQFNDAEIVKLTLAINVINMWNRFAIAFRAAHAVPKTA